MGKPDPLHNFGVALGTEHDVDVLSDTLSNHIIVSSKSVVVVLFRECTRDLKRNSPSSEVYMATLTFLAKCSEAGLYYR